MNSLLLFRDQMRLWRHEGWSLVGIDVVKTSHFATYFIESLAAEWGTAQRRDRTHASKQHGLSPATRGRSV